MVVERISNDGQVTDNELVCRIELTHEEAEAIMRSLMLTDLSGKQLTVSIELEDKMFEIIKQYR
jgi:hypothetical protein